MRDGSIIVAGSALALASVFGVAGVAKLRDRDSARATARAFGVPDVVARGVGVLLPPAELGVAAALLFPATRWWGAGGALALLVAFSTAIALALARGQAPACRCFGQLRPSPVGPWTLLRNGVLASFAATILITGRSEPGAGALTWAGNTGPAGWALVAAGAVAATLVAGGAYAVAYVLRSYGRVLVRLETLEARLREAGFELDEASPEPGLPPGTAAPPFWLPAIDGSRVALDELLHPGRPLLLLFTSPTCGPCTMLLPEIARWQREHAGELTVALVSDGDPDAVRAHASEHGLANILLDGKHEISRAYEANGTPSAVLIGDDGTVASSLAAGAEWIETLVEQALDGLGRTPGLPVGTPLPPLPLVSLDGGGRDLAELVDRPTVVLFWNPGCGHCRAMHEEVRAWERERPSEGPALVVVSAGNADDVRAEEFSSPVLLDPEWDVAAALGAGGTPMGLLLDGERVVASSPVAGAEAVLELLGAGRLSGTR